MSHDRYDDARLRAILRSVKTIAMVGASADPARPSALVLNYLTGRGYRVFAVNPKLAGGRLGRAAVYAALADIPEPIDMVEIFRRSEAAGVVLDEALALRPLPTVIWMQLGVRDDAAAARAEAAGVEVVMNRCPKIEHGRLSGELGWMGVNTRVLSSKRAVLGKGFQKRQV